MTSPPLSAVASHSVAAGSSVWEVHDEAVRRRQAGDHDIILLSVGDPDFPTPAPVNDYAIQQLNAERTHYSPAAGEPRLRQAIAQLESRIEGRRFRPDQCVVYPGATAALYVTIACLVNPGDEVLTTTPMYLGYPGIFATLGVTLRSLPMPADTGFTIDPDALLAAVGPRTRAILINTPGNPAGNVADAASLRHLAAGCRDAGVWLVCDEVYSQITFDAPHVSLLRAAARLDNVVVIDGLSKSHAMSGWRVGWTVSPAPLARALAAVAGSIFFGCSQFVQDAAAFALARDEPFVAAMRDEFHARRDLVVDMVNAQPGLSCVPPAGGMFVMADVRGVAADGEAFARRMLQRCAVATLPGRAFGDNTAGHVRISLTQPRTVLQRALQRMADVLG